MTTEYKCLLPFQDQSESFVLGFEAGMVYESLEKSILVKKTVHNKNAVLFRQMALRFGWNIEITQLDEDWAEMKMWRKTGIESTAV